METKTYSNRMLRGKNPESYLNTIEVFYSTTYKDEKE